MHRSIFAASPRLGRSVVTLATLSLSLFGTYANATTANRDPAERRSGSTANLLVEFAVDMSLHISTGNFDPLTDFVVIGGSTNGWSASVDTLVKDPDTHVYRKTIEIDDVSIGYRILYKYAIRFGFPSLGWESIARELVFDGDEAVDSITGRFILAQDGIPTYDDLSANDYLANAMTIVFEVDMRPAYYHLFDSAGMPADIGTGEATTFAEGVWGNGPILFNSATWSWVPWGPGDLGQVDDFRLHDDGVTGGDLSASDSVYTFTRSFAIGNRRVGGVKFGTDAYDNESPFARVHELVLPDFGITAGKLQGTARIRLIFGAMEGVDGTFSDTLYDPYICLSPDLRSATVVRRDGIGCTTALPVELTDFSAVSRAGSVVLTWETATETNNAGFAVELETAQGEYRDIGFVDGHGTTSSSQSYVFTASNIGAGIHRFRLRQIDFDGGFEYSSALEVVVAIPGQLVIEDPYPNPFNTSTSLRFAVASTQYVDMTLVNASGQLVGTLFSGSAAANETYRVTVDATSLASGAYIVRIDGESFLASRQILLVK